MTFSATLQVVQTNKKQAISRILSCLTIDLDPTLLLGSSRLPTSSRALLSNAGLLDVSPYRVYLISLQPNCTFFLLHLSYPLCGRRALPAILRCGVRTFLYTFGCSGKVACRTKIQVLSLINTLPMRM